MNSDALNWGPTAGANSVATIVTHVVGSEAETLRTVAGLQSARDREAEFAGRRLSVAEVLGLIDEADELVHQVRAHIDPDRLEQTCALPTLPATETRTGWAWLIGNYGHACEHLGHIELTTQLYRCS